MRRLTLLLVALCCGLALTARGPLVSAQGAGWEITSFDVSYIIQPDGSIDAKETLLVDFHNLPSRGIFRDFYQRVECANPIPGAEQPLHPCPSGGDRKYEYSVRSVTKLDGTPWKYRTENAGGDLRIRIGDENIFLQGPQEYVISYTLRGALDAYANHDELYWNVTGAEWEAPIESFSMTVTLPSGAELRAVCFNGYARSNEECPATTRANVASFETARPLLPREQVTVAVGWQKGVVNTPPPIIANRATIGDFFTLDTAELGGMLGSFIFSVGLIAWAWWTHGRDRSYTSLFYLTNNPDEHTRPLFARRDIVVEYLPPDDLKPAQMGVILDERADTLDVTATIVDLAVRGYLHITELPKKGWFGSNDWRLTKKKTPDDLDQFERRVFNGLFSGGKDEVDLSDLKYKFATHLEKAKDLLYNDAMKRKWFEVKPETARGIWVVVGFAMLTLGAALCILSATYWARGLAFAGMIPASFVMFIMSRSMTRRTAHGSEVLRRVLGFRLYIATAEKHLQEFNEQENIFARYLPFAIVFGCVSKWAKAFESLEAQASQSTASWYTGTSAFHVASFSSGLQSFSGSVSSTLASTQSSSGGSGFSGGSSGGGGGGGGGGRW